MSNNKEGERKKGIFKNIDNESLSKNFLLNSELKQYIKNELISLIKENEYEIYPQYSKLSKFDILVVIPDRVFTYQPNPEEAINSHIIVKMVGLHLFLSVKIWNDGPTSDKKNMVTIPFCPIDYLWIDKTKEKIRAMIATKYIINPSLMEKVGKQEFAKDLTSLGIMIMSQTAKEVIFSKQDKSCIFAHLKPETEQETVNKMINNKLWYQMTVNNKIDFQPLFLWVAALDDFYKKCDNKMSQIWVDNVKLDECERCQFISKTYKFPKITPKYVLDIQGDIIKGGDYVKNLLTYKDSIDKNKLR